MDLPTFLAYAGTPARGILTDLCTTQGVTGLDLDEVLTWKHSHYLEHHVHTVTPIEPVVRILNAAKAQGVVVVVVADVVGIHTLHTPHAGLPVAIASGGARSHVMRGLQHTGLLEQFDVVVTCEDYAHGKPAPDCFLLAAKQLGVSPELCVGYEDADLGMQAIEAAGFLKAVDVRCIAGYVW